MATASMAAPAPAPAGVVPSWEALLEQLPPEHQQAPTPRLPDATERIFEPDTAPALVLYRDNSAWCPYCERVWLQLEEKRVSYAVRKINMRCYGPKPEWFTRMVPSGLLPVVELDGRVVTESLDIMMLLERRFPDRAPLLPSAATPEAAAVDEFLRLERALVGTWLASLRGGSGWGGLGGGSSDAAFQSALDKVDAALRRFPAGPYFLGARFSLLDAVYAPFLERIAAGTPYWQGFPVRGGSGSARWPALGKWFDAMDARPAYAAIKSDDFTITHTLEPQVGPIASRPQGAAHRARITGRDGRSWDLPLRPEETAWGADDGAGGRAAAAAKVAGNRQGLVEFALRGVPDGARTDAVREHVDAALRSVAHALLVGVVDSAAAPVVVPEDGEVRRRVAAAVAYLRNRVGVPRDLDYPAARQLRAHLQWLLRRLGSDL